VAEILVLLRHGIPVSVIMANLNLMLRPVPQADGQYPGFAAGPAAGGLYPGFGAAPGQPPAIGTDPGQPPAPGSPAPQ
jgi:hypothetical protein